MEYKIVIHENKKYSIIDMKYKNVSVPVILDYEDFKIIDKMNKLWIINENGFVVYKHINENNELIEIYIHEIVMTIKQKDLNKNVEDKSIIHINRLGIDNRRENLIYSNSEEKLKNYKKKKRIVELPKNCKIDVNDIPTYVWYLKGDDTHGDRFMISIGDITWKTTSSNKLSLRYKLEEAKKFLRQLKIKRPDLFKNYSMNGEYNELGKKLIKSFFELINKANYKHLNMINIDGITDSYLEMNLKDLNDMEINLLHEINFEYNCSNRNKLIKELDNSKDKKFTLPLYCYYIKMNENKGDFFYIDNHPKLKKRWYTSTSKNVSTEDKYQEMMKYLEYLNHL